MATSNAVSSRLRAVRTSKRADEPSSKSTQNVFERLPPEILVKILSLLDPSALFSISHTNKLFYQLASNKNLRVTWELTVTDMSGHKTTLGLSWSQFSETSLTLCWCGGDCLLSYEEILILQLHGVRRIALSHPSLKKLSRRSLMANLDMQSLTKCIQVIGQDQLVQLKLLQPGLIIGLWRHESSVAFIMFTLHFYKLVERSTQGSYDCSYVEPVIQPPFDDIDPEYGLHGYQLHIVLHNSECKLMSESFSQLFCHRAHISDGWIQLTAISRTNPSQHIRLLGMPTLPWKCEALKGSVENCCIMSLTLLDEFRKPFRCVTSPVSMELETAAVSYDYDGEHYLIQYKDSDIQVKMQLAKMNAKRQFVISLIVYVSVWFVNKHFSRDY
ncbi:F-box only protein 15 isoform 2-T2 [Anableps anableps]